jgi:hypothetical protein
MSAHAVSSGAVVLSLIHVEPSVVRHSEPSAAARTHVVLESSAMPAIWVDDDVMAGGVTELHLSPPLMETYIMAPLPSSARPVTTATDVLNTATRLYTRVVAESTCFHV